MTYRKPFTGIKLVKWLPQPLVRLTVVIQPQIVVDGFGSKYGRYDVTKWLQSV